MSTIKSKEDALHVVSQDKTLIPIVDVTDPLTPVPISVTPLQLGILPTDANGNVLANVSLRTGTLDSLLAISDAGDGEVAVATDTEALVVYRGDPISVGAPYYKSSLFYTLFSSIGFQSIPVGASWVQLTVTGILDTDGWLVFGILENYPYLTLPKISGAKSWVKLTGLVSTLAGTAAGTIVSFQIQRLSAGLWFDMLSTPLTGVVPASGVLELPVTSVSNLTNHLINGEVEQLRLAVQHDSASAVFFAGDSVVLEFFESLTS